MVDTLRIELMSPRCERGVLPLNYRPKIGGHGQNRTAASCLPDKRSTTKLAARKRFAASPTNRLLIALDSIRVFPAENIRDFSLISHGH